MSSIHEFVLKFVLNNTIMDRTLNINELVNEIEKLDYKDKINLMARIVKLLKREEKTSQEYPITRLKGLGKNVWSKTDIASYIETERESWD